MIRDTLHTAVARAITAAQTAGDLPAFEPPEFTIEHPRQAEMADYAASVAMQLARVARQAPPKIAAAIVKHVASTVDYTVEAAAGYVNFKLSTDRKSVV